MFGRADRGTYRHILHGSTDLACLMGDVFVKNGDFVALPTVGEVSRASCQLTFFLMTS